MPKNLSVGDAARVNYLLGTPQGDIIMSGDERWNIGRFGLVGAFEDRDKLTAPPSSIRAKAHWF